MFFLSICTPSALWFRASMDYSPLSIPNNVQFFPPLLLLVHLLHHVLLIILSETAGLWHLGNAAGTRKVNELLPGLRNCWGCPQLPLDPSSCGFQSGAERARIPGKGWDGMKCGPIKISQNLFKCILACLRFVKSTPEPTFTALGVKIFNIGTSPQGMRTCYLQRLLCKRLGNGGRTHWCDGKWWENPLVWHISRSKIKTLVYIQGTGGWLNICHEHIKLPPLSRETLTYRIWIYSPI